MKKIFVTQRVEEIKSYGEIRDCIDVKWNQLLKVAGYLPILVPNSKMILEDLLTEISPDGILLTGGNDLYKYGGNAEQRDEVEAYLIQYAIRNKISVIGVCRGMQMIVDYFGGKLEKVENHVAVQHSIIGDTDTDKVNSFHNFGIYDTPDVLESLYKSNDGVIEAVKHKVYNIYGQMWHPERYEPFRERDILKLQEIFG